MSAPVGERRSRAEWYADIKPYYDSGMTPSEISRLVGISQSFASSLVNDPDGSKEKQRKRVYEGVCVGCGGSTNGGDGRGEKAPERCAECSHAHRAETQRIWTRETVIAAIQRFARENGRPPSARDWFTQKPGSGYPWPGSVYRSKSHANAPFRCWADAIEAAGFPRPRSGHYDRSRA